MFYYVELVFLLFCGVCGLGLGLEQGFLSSISQTLFFLSTLKRVLSHFQLCGMGGCQSPPLFAVNLIFYETALNNNKSLQKTALSCWYCGFYQENIYKKSAF